LFIAVPIISFLDEMGIYIASASLFISCFRELIAIFGTFATSDSMMSLVVQDYYMVRCVIVVAPSPPPPILLICY